MQRKDSRYINEKRKQFLKSDFNKRRYLTIISCLEKTINNVKISSNTIYERSLMELNDFISRTVNDELMFEKFGRALPDSYENKSPAQKIIYLEKANNYYQRKIADYKRIKKNLNADNEHLSQLNKASKEEVSILRNQIKKFRSWGLKILKISYFYQDNDKEMLTGLLAKNDISSFLTISDNYKPMKPVKLIRMRNWKLI